LMIANWVYWRRVSGASKRIFATIKSTIDAVKYSKGVTGETETAYPSGAPRITTGF
jgi:hypothetical protein